MKPTGMGSPLAMYGYEMEKLHLLLPSIKIQILSSCLKMHILSFVYSRNCLVLRRNECYFSFDDTRGSLFGGRGGHQAL